MKCSAHNCDGETPNPFCDAHWAKVPRPEKQRLWELLATKKRKGNAKALIRLVMDIANCLAGEEIQEAIAMGEPLTFTANKPALERVWDKLRGKTVDLKRKVVITDAAPLEPVLGADGRIYVQNHQVLQKLLLEANAREKQA